MISAFLFKFGWLFGRSLFHIMPEAIFTIKIIEIVSDVLISAKFPLILLHSPAMLCFRLLIVLVGAEFSTLPPIEIEISQLIKILCKTRLLLIVFSFKYLSFVED